MDSTMVRRWIPWIVAVALSAMSLSCVEIRIVKAAITDGPSKDGALTVRLDLAIDIEQHEPEEGEEMQLPDAQTNMPCYLAMVAPRGVEPAAARALGAAEMFGEAGVRAMGRSPQVARLYQREFPTPEGQRWIAYHAIVDRVDVTRSHEVAMELDLDGVPPGTTELLVSLGYLEDANSDPDPVRPTVLELTVGSGKAVVRVVPRAVPAGVEET